MGIEPAGRGETERVDALLARIMAEAGFGKSSVVVEVDRHWQQVVGETVALHTRPIGYRRGVLIVEVDSAAWQQELTSFRKQKVLQRLAEECPRQKIHDVKFEMAGLKGSKR